MLARAPLRTNLATAVPMMVAGDLIAQRFEHGGDAVDLERTTVMASYSGFVFTPVFFYLYKVQERVLTRGPPVLLAAQKATFSIVVGGVPVNCVFLALATAVEMAVFGKEPAGEEKSLGAVVRRKWREDLPRIMLGSLSFWGPVNFCNFYWTPPKYRILVVSASAVAWNCYLSLVQHEVFAPPPGHKRGGD